MLCVKKNYSTKVSTHGNLNNVNNCFQCLFSIATKFIKFWKKKVFPKIPISIEVTEYGNLREATISNIHLLTLINSVLFKLHIFLYLLEVF